MADKDTQTFHKMVNLMLDSGAVEDWIRNNAEKNASESGLNGALRRGPE